MTIRKIKPAVKRKRPKNRNQLFQKKILETLGRIETSLSAIHGNQKHAYRHPK